MFCYILYIYVYVMMLLFYKFMAFIICPLQ